MASPSKLSPAAVYESYKELGSYEAAARKHGCAPSTVKYHVGRFGAANNLIAKDDRAEVPDLPTGDLTIEELLERRSGEFIRKQAYWEARRCISVKVKIDGPFGIHFFGDPHLDDPGTDISLLRRHVEIVKKTPAMLAANVGDTTNNWIGRLAIKYGDQETTRTQGWMLAEWFIKELKGTWLFLVAGNHDLWSGAGDPINWIARCAKTLYEPSQVRMELKASGDSIFVNTRHDFHGSSQYNPAHGPQKASIFGFRDHLNICGHKHKSGYSVFWDMQQKRLCHNIQVAAYKVYDEYAREKGFPELHISPAVTIVVTPGAPEQSKLHVFWDLEEATAFLKFKRAKA